LFLCLTGETKKSMEGLGFVLFDAFVYTGAWKWFLMIVVRL
jgi:hypothetical protein